jgi:DNA-binding transcriptional LysR family regulator
MNMQSLKYFLAIDKYQSFSIASDELSLSQSSLSKHIKSLESELNCVLFDRSTKHLRITEAGLVFKEYAIMALQDYNNILSKIDEFSSNRPKLSLGYIPVITQYKITNIIGLYNQKFSNVNLNLKESEHNDIINMLTKGELDFAFLRNENITSDIFEIIPLVTDELVLLTSKSHPLSQKKYVSFSSLSNENFILLGKGSGVYDTCVNQARKNGFELKVSCLNSRIENIFGLVSAGLGISLLMKKAVECFNSENVEIILLKEKIISNLSLVYLKDKKISNHEEDFKNFLISHFRIR